MDARFRTMLHAYDDSLSPDRLPQRLRTQLGVPMNPRGWLTVVRGNPASALEGLGVDIGDQVWVSGNAAPAD